MSAATVVSNGRAGTFTQEFSALEQLKDAFCGSEGGAAQSGLSPRIQKQLAVEAFNAGCSPQKVLEIYRRLSATNLHGEFVNMYFAGYEASGHARMSGEQMIEIYKRCLASSTTYPAIALKLSNVAIETGVDIDRVIKEFNERYQREGQSHDVVEFADLYRLYALGHSRSLKAVIRAYDDIRSRSGECECTCMELTKACLDSGQPTQYVVDFYRAAVGTVHSDRAIEAMLIARALSGEKAATQGRSPSIDSDEWMGSLSLTRATITRSKVIEVEAWMFDADLEGDAEDAGSARIIKSKKRRESASVVEIAEQKRIADRNGGRPLLRLTA